MPATAGTVGIAGTGLLGASIGLRARAQGSRVFGFDVDARALEAAQRCGAIDSAVRHASELLGMADILVLASPVDAIVADLRAFPERASTWPDLIVDVGSIKVPVAKAGARVENFVASHPVAGLEKNGPEAARADLFENALWLYVPPGSAALRERAVAFFKAMGAARCVPVEAADHDAIVAATSHLPQALSVVLGAYLSRSGAAPGLEEFAGSGLASMLRLASSHWPMWNGVFTGNARNVAQELRGLARHLSAVAEGLESGDPSALEAAFLQANSFAARVRRARSI